MMMHGLANLKFCLLFGTGVKLCLSQPAGSRMLREEFQLKRKKETES